MSTKNYRKIPVYQTQQEDRLFRAIVTYNGKKYTSSYWEKNKRFAEQGAALVCLLDLGIVEEEIYHLCTHCELITISLVHV